MSPSRSSRTASGTSVSRAVTVAPSGTAVSSVTVVVLPDHQPAQRRPRRLRRLRLAGRRLPPGLGEGTAAGAGAGVGGAVAAGGVLGARVGFAPGAGFA